ncbi:MAG TPA: hypothetical protein PLL99_00310 [Chitinophagales bacterium]|jgi:hypothetical protein|nr:hypothetical protein [Chitinophagales bacterium]HQG37679.1 hypothetical protein [Chitinophagales bacterium]
MYKILRFFLFKFNAEAAHHLTLNLFSFLIKIPFVKSILQYFYAVENKKLERTVFALGVEFKVSQGLGVSLNLGGRLTYFPGQHINDVGGSGF